MKQMKNPAFLATLYYPSNSLSSGEHNHTVDASATNTPSVSSVEEKGLRLLTPLKSRSQLPRLKSRLGMKTKSANRCGSVLQCTHIGNDGRECPYRLICR